MLPARVYRLDLRSGEVVFALDSREPAELRDELVAAERSKGDELGDDADPIAKARAGGFFCLSTGTYRCKDVRGISLELGLGVGGQEQDEDDDEDFGAPPPGVLRYPKGGGQA